LGLQINLTPAVGRASVQRARDDAVVVGLFTALLVPELVLLSGHWEASHWQPVWLVLVLAGFTVLGELDAVRIGSVYVSSTACALLLALALLGPVPAVLIGVGATVLDWVVYRKALWAGLGNVAIMASATLAGALVLDGLAGTRPHEAAGGAFAAAVFLAGATMAATNLLLIGLYRKLRLGRSFREALTDCYLPTIPYHMLGITLATAAAQIVVAGDFPVWAAIVPALLVSEFLLRSVAAERARADEVTALTAERATLLEQALSAEVAEREWIAGHVHDETLQTLALTRQDLDDAEGGEPAAIEAARRHLDGAVDELRRTLVHVHPGSVAGQGLGPTLEAYAAQVLRRSGAAWRIDVEPGAGEGHQSLLYSLARELLANAARHARAAHVRLQIAGAPGSVRLTVADDGVGIDADEVRAPGHFGLLTARQRVAAAGGRLTIETAPGEGSRVEVVLPDA
jgi:two-component system NarL family sensor kinase